MPYKNPEQLKLYNRMYYKNKKQNQLTQSNQSNKSNTDDDVKYINMDKSNNTDPSYVFDNILKNMDTSTPTDDTLLQYNPPPKLQKYIIQSKTQRNRIKPLNQLKPYTHNDNTDDDDDDNDDDDNDDDELELIDDMPTLMPRFIRHMPYNLLRQKTMDLSNTLEQRNEPQLKTILDTGNILYGEDISRTKTEFYYFELVCAVMNLECTDK
jgi:hypothetical protein